MIELHEIRSHDTRTAGEYPECKKANGINSDIVHRPMIDSLHQNVRFKKSKKQTIGGAGSDK